MSRAIVIGLIATVLWPFASSAQNSIYGVRGIGFPGRAHSVRARGMAGASAVFELTSTENPGTIAGFSRLTVHGQMGTTFRDYEASGVSASGLQEARFPTGVLGSRLGRSALFFSLSYSPYAERSFDVATEGTVQLADVTIDVEDRFRSDGAVVDLRAGLGVRAGSRVQLGGAFHLLRGSTRNIIQREFLESDLATFVDSSSVTFSGFGLSGGLLYRSGSGAFQTTITGRWDHRLASNIEGVTVSEVDLPVSVAGGFQFRLTPGTRFHLAGRWQGWSVADGDLADGTTEAFDTYEVSSGLEFALGLPIPFRLGGRYATLPFGPAGDQPTEWTAAFGVGQVLAGGRAALDAALERLFRRGTGVNENAWHVSVGFTITP